MSDIMSEQSNSVAGIGVTGSNLGNALQSLLLADAIEPGSQPSYELCKQIYLTHPLGAKMVELPLQMAQSQQREISIPAGPEEQVREAFLSEWKSLSADKHIFNTMRLSRIYGMASIVYGAPDIPTNRPINPLDFSGLNIFFNVLDPLNTGGSLVLNQDANAPDFQKVGSISVAGEPYHRSRACVILNEEPIFIGYTVSAFGYVGRSVYQRALFPLKSYIQSMVTDDMVTKKAGLLVAMIERVTSIADRFTMGLISVKRNLLKEAQTGNVISIGPNDRVESLNLQNTDTAMTTARDNILDNIAAATPMPSKLLTAETYAEGFSEGAEDAKEVVRFIDSIREAMQPLYDYFDEIVMYRAWNLSFYEAVQSEFPEYRNVSYTEAFFKWKNSFKAKWPSLLIEPESELIKVDEVKLKAMLSAAQVILPVLDPDNKLEMLSWLQSNTNELVMLFTSSLALDFEALKSYVTPASILQGAEA